MYCHTISNNRRKSFLDLKGHIKSEADEKPKSSKYKAIIKSAHYDGNRKLTLNHYYSLVDKSFLYLEEAGPVYTFSDAQKTNSFENGLKEPTAIKFSATAKREWNKLPANHQSFDTYYNSMSASYEILQYLIYLTKSRVTQQSNISQLNTGSCGRGGYRHGIGYGGRVYVRGCGHGLGGRGGSVVNSYGHSPYEFASGYRTFVAEDHVYPADQWRLLYLQQNNNIQEIKTREGWGGFNVPPEGYKLDCLSMSKVDGTQWEVTECD